MFRRLWAAVALLVAACLSAPALAADPTGASLPFVQGGQTYNEWVWMDGSGRFRLGGLLYGWTGSDAKALSADPNGYLGVNVFSSVLAPGAATSAKQDQLLAALGSPLQAGGSVTQGGAWTFGLTGTLPAFAAPPTFNLGTAPSLTIASSALPTGAAQQVTLAAIAAGALSKVDSNGYLYVTVSNPGSGGSGSAPAAVDGSAQAAAATVSPMAGKGSDGKTHALLTDASGNLAANVLTLPSVTVGSSALPTGAATASGVAAVVTALGSPLQTGGSVSVSNLPSTQAISAAALPLPSGAATATGVAAVVTALGTPLQAGGTVSVSNLPATQAISASALPLPSGAATATGVAAVVTALGTPLQAGGAVTVSSSALAAGAATSANQSTQITAEQAIQTAETATIVHPSYTTALAASATYTGATRDATAAVSTGVGVSYFNATFYSDQAGVAYIDLSDDGSTWVLAVAGQTLAAATPLTLTAPLLARYYRARLINGTTAQTTVRVSSAFAKN